MRPWGKQGTDTGTQDTQDTGDGHRGQTERFRIAHRTMAWDMSEETFRLSPRLPMFQTRTIRRD
jgi:hypothetical protein